MVDWYFMVLVSVLALSSSVLLQRVLIHKGKVDPVAYSIIYQGIASLILFTYSLFVGFELPPISEYWPLMLLTFMLFALGNIAYAKTLQLVEASVFTVLFASNLFWIMLYSFVFFGDRLGVAELFGILMIISSVVIITNPKFSFQIDDGLKWGLLTGFLMGSAIFSWVYVGRSSDSLSWNAISFAGPAVLLMIIFGRSKASELKRFAKTDLLLKIVLISFFTSLSSLTLMLAYQNGVASLVSSLHQSNVIVTVIMAIFILGERSKLKRKALASAICLAGVLLVV
jgi:drug/metabolite transporter (DMT)-like permease